MPKTNSKPWMSDSIFKEIGRHPLLTPKQERVLCCQVEADMADYRQRLDAWERSSQRQEDKPRLPTESIHAIILHNMRLAVKFATILPNRNIDREELFQEAIMGLAKAASMFDTSRGVKFSTYAVWWIRQFILRYVHNHGATVRIPGHMVRLLINYRQLKQEVLSKRSRLPTRAEALRRLKCNGRRYYEVLKLDERTTVSLSDPTGDKSIVDGLADESGDRLFADICQHEDRNYLEDLLRFLPDNQRTVISMRFGLDGPPASLIEVGQVLGLTRERIRQIELKALDRMHQRATKTARGVREFANIER